MFDGLALGLRRFDTKYHHFIDIELQNRHTFHWSTRYLRRFHMQSERHISNNNRAKGRFEARAWELNIQHEIDWSF